MSLMKSTSYFRAMLAASVLFVLIGCGSDTSTKPDAYVADQGKAQGTEGGPCYGNGTCNAGLTCQSNICVRQSDLGPKKDSQPNQDGAIDAAGDMAGDMAADMAADIPIADAAIDQALSDAAIDQVMTDAATDGALDGASSDVSTIDGSSTSDATADLLLIDGTMADAQSSSDGGLVTGITGNNPEALGSGKRKTIVIDGANTNGEWGADTLLIQDPAGDDARFLGTNWSAHEAPWDYSALHAAWDDNYLYIGIQFVNITDAVDGANLGSSEGSQIQGMDLIQAVLFDVHPNVGYKSGGDMWGKTKEFSGKNQPDYQLYFHSNFSQEGTYWGEWNSTQKKLVQITDGLKNTNLSGKSGEFYVGSTLPGVVPNSDNSSPGTYSQTVDYLVGGSGVGVHSTQYDTFFEVKIPLSLLGLGPKSLDNLAIGIFAVNGDLSSVDSIPNDPATSDTHGTSQSNSPLEWADNDVFSSPFVLVGKP
jgi:hypothetical protein